MSQKQSVEILGQFDGQKLVYDRNWFRQQTLELCGNKPCPISLKVTKSVYSKTTRQNAYFHVIVKVYFDALVAAGETTVTVSYGSVKRVRPLNFERAKEMLKLEVDVQKIENGGFVSVNCGTASKSEMSAMIEGAIVFLRENFGIQVPPDPNKKEKKC